MAKTIKIDKINKRIIFELDRDARQTANEIAKKIGISRDAVAYRTRQLEKNGYIQGYYTLIDPIKLGYKLIRLYLKFKNTTLDIEKEIAEFLVNEKSTLTVYDTEGNWDLAVGFLYKDLSQFYDYYMEFKKKYRPHIHEENFSMFIEYVIYNKNYLVDEKYRDLSVKSTFRSKEEKIDEENLKLLRLLAENARMPLLEMAQKMDMSSMAVKYRIKKLEEKKVILGYKAMINHAKLGYEYYKVDFILDDVNKVSSFRQFGKMHPNVVYEDRAAGGSDFEFDLELKSHDDFLAIIHELKKLFPGVIRTYKYYKASRIHKYVYLPPE